MKFSELIVDEVIPEDAGKYTVVVENVAGVTQCEAILTVVEALDKPIQKSPEFVINLRDKDAKVTDRVTFECKVVGIPEPEITWLRDNEKITEEPDKIKIESDNGVQRLIIEDVEMAHQGVYTCRAENVVGKSETTATLKVEGPVLKY